MPIGDLNRRFLVAFGDGRQIGSYESLKQAKKAGNDFSRQFDTEDLEIIDRDTGTEYSMGNDGKWYSMSQETHNIIENLNDLSDDDLDAYLQAKRTQPRFPR